MTVDFASLTLLVDIIDAGNLSKAASKLKMTRANVSYHLRQLEKALGVELIRRTSRRMEPTELGWRLCEHGRAIRNEMASAHETVTNLGQGLQGRVGISVPSGYGHIVMSPWLIEFKQRYPGVVLDVVFENRIDNLRDDVDIAIRILPEPPDTMVAKDMGTVRFLACASKQFAHTHGMPTELAQLRTQPIITANVVGRQLSLRAYRGDARQEVMLTPTVISDHYPFLKEAILGGLGIGLVPDYMVADVIASGDVVTTLDDHRLSIFGTHMYLLYLPSRHRTRAIQTCIDFLVDKANAQAGPKP
ncbi:MAG: LysR family transcriptional regulator [Limnohabitans sp.]|nr:LysR family transcriptional regulator [Limnohabitans sp.]